MMPAVQIAAVQLHALTYNLDLRQAASKNITAPINHTSGLHPISIHQMAPPVQGSKHPITSYYSVCRPGKDEKLSWPSWLTCSGRFTHISAHSSAAGRAQDRKSTPVEDRHSTTVLSHQQLGITTITTGWQGNVLTRASLSVCQQNNSESYECIFVKYGQHADYGPQKSRLNFGIG